MPFFDSKYKILFVLVSTNNVEIFSERNYYSNIFILLNLPTILKKFAINFYVFYRFVNSKIVLKNKIFFTVSPSKSAIFEFFESSEASNKRGNTVLI